MIDLSILKPIALASMLATGAAGTTVATGVLDGPAAESLHAQVAGSAPLSEVPPAAAPERGQRRNGERMERGAQAMLQRLDLTEAQVAELRQILATSRERARAIRELEPGQRGQARRALNQSTRAAIAAVLTPAQKASFEAMHAERAGRRAEAGPRVGQSVERRAQAAERRAQATERRGGPSTEHRAQATERRGGPSAEHRAQAVERRAQGGENGNRPAQAGPRRGPRAQQ